KRQCGVPAELEEVIIHAYGGKLQYTEPDGGQHVDHRGGGHGFQDRPLRSEAEYRLGSDGCAIRCWNARWIMSARKPSKVPEPWSKEDRKEASDCRCGLLELLWNSFLSRRFHRRLRNPSRQESSRLR